MTLHPDFLESPELPSPIARGLSFESYVAIKAANAHGLMRVLRSPQHYLTDYLAPFEPIEGGDLGSLVHLASLEQAAYSNTVLIGPDVKTRAVKAWKEFEASAPPGKILLKPAEAARVEEVVDSLRAHPIASKLLFGSEGMSEVSFVWQDTDANGIHSDLHHGTGRWCKGRVDRVIRRDDNRLILVDLKTTSNAMYESFVRDSYRMLYDLQGAHYVAGWNAITGAPPEAIDYLFVVVEDKAPYAVAVYNADPAFLESGHIRRSVALKRLDECIRCNHFPAYNTEIRPLGVPAWAKTDMVLTEDAAVVNSRGEVA